MAKPRSEIADQRQPAPHRGAGRPSDSTRMHEEAASDLLTAPAARPAQPAAPSAPRAGGPNWRERWTSWRHLPAERRWSRAAYWLRRPLFMLPGYGRLLDGAPSATPRLPPLDPWPGDAERGTAIIRGDFALAGLALRADPAPWRTPDAPEAWLRELHAFDWLRDLRAAGGDPARRRARELTGAWVEAHPRWSTIAWAPEVTGRRLANWLGHYDFFASSAEILDRQRLLKSAMRQARHLERVLPAGLGGLELLGAIKGLIYAGLALPNRAGCLRRGLELLERELARQILPDGGHASRSPAAQLRVLRDLIDLRAALHAAKAAAPPDLAAAIEGMAPMLRLFLHGDGRLALFNDSNEEEDWQIDLVLQRAQGRKHPLVSAPQSGFQRLQAGRVLVLVDAGAPPAPGFDGRAHAGALSFEMSVGRERLVVNCGAHWGPWIWRELQRTTAAHSTLTLGQTNSSALLRAGGLGRRRAAVTCHRQEDGGSLWLETSHDGYLGSHGALHRRRLFLAAAGDDLRGEDCLIMSDEQRKWPDPDFAIRFHLHPDVQASLVRGGDSVMLRLPKGGGWRLLARGAAIALEPGVYLGTRGEIRRSQQIVLSGRAIGAETIVKWALRRESRPRESRGR